MIVNRSVVINPIEPGQLSFRAPMGIATRLNVSFYGQNGAPYGSDLGAQLQLTGRTSARTNTYIMPATDIANGRARATIPAGELDDPNGWRLRLVGTLNSEPALLALGTVMPIAAAGLEAVPEDLIDTVDLAFDYDEKVELDIAVWTDTGKDVPYDLMDAQTTLTASIYNVKGGAIITPFSVTVIDENEVKLSLTVAQVNALPPSCWWTMVASTAAGATTLCEGSVTINGSIVPPITETILNYDYQNPDTGSPASGQIVHGNFTRNLLQVAKVDADATDQSAFLTLVRLGDQIVIGLTAWTVGAITEQSGWFEFTVLPIQQSATTGLTAVTFKPPDNP